MTATARLLEQRSVGHVHLRMECDGIAIMREAGSAKCRMPRGTREAILINTSGGLAGGDKVFIKAEVGAGATLTLTSQAAERVYRTLGPAAEVQVDLSVAKNASLFWLPQETIAFEGSALSRSLNVVVSEGATFLAVEPLVFGRTEMGEHINHISILDQWNVRRQGKLVHAEALRLGPNLPMGEADLAGHHAMATLLFISPIAETLLEQVREVLGPSDGASAWNGKLVARLLAKDGFHLRKTLIQVLAACAGRVNMPKCWTF
jgi:urease accessory protein